MEKTNVKSAWTSKVLSALLFVFMAALFVACSPANSIKGHTYFTGTSDNGKKIYFSPSGAAQITYYDKGSTTTFLHLNYTIKSDIVEIYFDYSDYWKLEAQGTLAEHYVYDKETDILVSDEGIVLHRLQ